MKAHREQVFQYLRNQIAWAFDCSQQVNHLHDVSDRGVASFGSKCLLAPWAFSQKPIVLGVNRLTSFDKTLLFFATSLPVSKQEITAFTVSLWFDFYHKYHVGRRLNSKSIPKAQRLLEYALIDYKNCLDGKPVTKDKVIMDSISVSDAKNFRRDWVPRLAIMKALIAQKERDALSQVLAFIDDRAEQLHA